MLRYALNCSIMLRDHPVRDRLAIAADAGFAGVEFWWPFDSATPDAEAVDDFVSAVTDGPLPLIALNLYAGDMPNGDRGIISWPGRESEVEASALIAREIAARTGVSHFNALYGNRLSAHPSTEQDAVARHTLRLAADILADAGHVLVEAVSGADRYPLRGADDVVAVLDEVAGNGGPDLGLLFDMYHLAANGDDVESALARHMGRIQHVQVADAPGRGAPGTGTLPLSEWVEALETAGYRGWVAFEHLEPAGTPQPSLAPGITRTALRPSEPAPPPDR
ncbi:MAG TPA: TIM barrel protein [Pseudolysinimonas sp.]|nr:TIM barrel protein [Pseudolysinimonas sp.]